VFALIGLLGLGTLLKRRGREASGDDAGILTRWVGRIGSHATSIGK